MKKRIQEKKLQVVITWLTNLVLIAALYACSQQTEQTMQQNKIQKMIESKVLKLEDLNEVQYSEWTSLLENWQSTDFDSYLKELGFKQDCKECGSIILKVQMSIDKDGHFTELKVLEKSMDCEQKTSSQKAELENKIIESFKKKVFPDSLKTTKLEVQIGRASKC